MARRTKRSLHPYQNVPARRGVAAYVGVSADAADDPAIVWPARPVVVPADAVTPLTAGADTVPGGAGGGGVTVDNTVDAVAPIESFVIPGAVIAGTEADLSAIGGEQKVSLLGPFAVAFNTPGLNNPSDNGALIVAIPAGTLVRAFLMVNTVWSAAGEFILSLSSPDRSTTAQTLGGYTAQGDAANAFSQIEGVSAYPGDQSALSRYGFTIQDCVITASFFPDAGDPTTGAGDIYVLIAEPA